jgi:potassium channel subfamily K
MNIFTDLINIVAVTTFVIYHRFDNSFTYGQSFWMTVCSTAASCFTNATLIWDLYRTSEFNKSGKQILLVVDRG